MTDPIRFGANPQPAPSRNTASEVELRFEQSSKSRYSYSESTVVRLKSGEPSRSIIETNAVDTLSPEQAANNILQFIAQRLASLKAGGADNDALRAALVDAREGFASGVEQAVGILRAGGSFDDTQSARLARIEKRFDEGITSIAQNIFGNQSIDDAVEELTREQVGTALAAEKSEPAPAPVATAIAADTAAVPAKVAVQFSASESYRIKQKSTQSIAANDNKIDKRIENSSDRFRKDDNFASDFIERYQSTRASFKRRESVDLQLRTQDGDLITLSFNAKQAGKFRFDSAQGIGQFGSNREFAKLFGSSELNISIVGEIDDQEFAALEQLFDQLSELFGTFFRGDNASALEQALSLDIDTSEIAQLSIDLQLKEEQKLVQKYREIAGIGIERDREGADSKSRRATLADYLEQIRDIAVAKSKTTDKTLLEQLLSITFAGGELSVEPASDGEEPAPAKTDDPSVQVAERLPA